MSYPLNPRLRALVLEAHNHTCHYCGDRAGHVDHIIAEREQESGSHPSNLIAACAPCNMKKGGRRLAPEALANAQAKARSVAAQIAEQLAIKKPSLKERRSSMANLRLDVYPSADLRRAIDRWRIEQPDSPTRAEAARRLLELALRGLERLPTQAAMTASTAGSIFSNDFMRYYAEGLSKGLPSREAAMMAEIERLRARRALSESVVNAALTVMREACEDGPDIWAIPEADGKVLNAALDAWEEAYGE